MCREKGEMIKRNICFGSDYVKIYTLSHDGGCCILYINEADGKKYIENMTFMLYNLKIDGRNEKDTKYNLELAPGEEKFIKLNKIDPEKAISYGKSARY